MNSFLAFDIICEIIWPPPCTLFLYLALSPTDRDARRRCIDILRLIQWLPRQPYAVLFFIYTGMEAWRGDKKDILNCNVYGNTLFHIPLLRFQAVKIKTRWSTYEHLSCKWPICNPGTLSHREAIEETHYKWDPPWAMDAEEIEALAATQMCLCHFRLRVLGAEGVSTLITLLSLRLSRTEGVMRSSWTTTFKDTHHLPSLCLFDTLSGKLQLLPPSSQNSLVDLHCCKDVNPRPLALKERKRGLL